MYPFLSSNQKLLLTRACEDLEREKQEREEEKVRYLDEKNPPLKVSGLSLDDLQVKAANHKWTAEKIILGIVKIGTSFNLCHPQNLCQLLDSKINVVDEERYDCESKVNKHNKDVSLFCSPEDVVHVIIITIIDVVVVIIVIIIIFFISIIIIIIIIRWWC